MKRTMKTRWHKVAVLRLVVASPSVADAGDRALAEPRIRHDSFLALRDGILFGLGLHEAAVPMRKSEVLISNLMPGHQSMIKKVQNQP